MRHIENPAAYEAAIAARIRQNATITRRRVFFAKFGPTDAEFLAWLGFTSDATATPELAELDRISSEAFATDDKYCTATSEAAYAAANRAYHKAAEAWRKSVGTVPTFLREARDQWGSLTDGQIAFARKVFAENKAKSDRWAAEAAEKRATATAWVAGRQVVAGRVLSLREQVSTFGYHPTYTTKMLVETPSGAKLWVTRPDAIYMAKVGDTVSMTVTVELSPNDPIFAFGKRPSKATIVEEK